MALFTEEFDVESSNGAAYRRFIENFRSHPQLGVRFSHNRPVLPPQENPPNRWFDVVLRTRSQAIRLRIRLDNLYLDAYRAENSDQWLEFGRSPSPHLINGSTFLGFDGGYNGLQYAADRRMENINLGRWKLITAVNQLATSTIGQERACKLIVVIQMISESIRFQLISDHLVTTFEDGAPPPNWMMALEHGWQDVSAALLRADANPEGRFPLPQPNAMLIDNALEAAEQIGILLDCITPLHLRPPRMVETYGQYLRGRPLVEVFWVRVDNIDEEDPGDLYGTVKVTDGVGSQYLYNRGRDDYESIHPRQNALLTGPARAISAYGSFTIDLDLKDKDTDLSPDDEVSSGQISWNVYNTTNVYDESLSDEVGGEYGSVTVNYVVLSNAAEAKVEVVLIEGDREDPADVYGSITARNGIGESELFRKASEEHVDVRPGQLIPLSRSIVAVPLDSSLRVRAELYDHDDVTSDDEIAKGTAEFPVQLSTSSEKVIDGKYGKIGVRVAWT